MKKPNLIIGKKQIILSSLTLMLGIAVYVNYAMAGGISLPEKTAMTEPSLSADSGEGSENYGDTQFVNGGTTADYFAQARLEKQTSRDAAVQTLQSIIGGGDLTEEEMVSHALNAVEVSKLVENESTIESLIKAQGFTDCVVYLDGESAKVVVQTEGLEPAQAAAIKDIILSVISIPTENIRIFEVK